MRSEIVGRAATFPDIVGRGKGGAHLTLRLSEFLEFRFLGKVTQMHIKTLFTTTASLLFAGMLASAQTPPCSQTITQDLQAVSADLSAIVAQADAQGFQAAAEKFAADLETILPTLSKPSQEAVEKFTTDLIAATSASSPGGTQITASERLKLTADWSAVVTSTGITAEQIETIQTDLANALSTLKGISTAQLRADLQTLAADLSACRTTK